MHSQKIKVCYLVNAYFAYGAYMQLRLASNPTLTFLTEENWNRTFSLKNRKIDIWGDYLPGRALETHTQGLFFYLPFITLFNNPIKNRISENC